MLWVMINSKQKSNVFFQYNWVERQYTYTWNLTLQCTNYFSKYLLFYLVKCNIYLWSMHLCATYHRCSRTKQNKATIPHQLIVTCGRKGQKNNTRNGICYNVALLSHAHIVYTFIQYQNSWYYTHTHTATPIQ